MRVLTLEAPSGESEILLGADLSRLTDHAGGRPLCVVTDERVWSAVGHRLPGVEPLFVGQGEGSKTLDTITHLYDAFFERQLDRHGFVVGLGGGMVCDMAGFAAATYQRGLPFAFAPTTLLAQVDAAIGGKNGVNFKGFKNLVGTVRQPRFVLIDPTVLQTLSQPLYVQGLAEVVKAACLGDVALLHVLETQHEAVLAREAELLDCVTERAIDVKRTLVQADENEQGVRRWLNLGHTLAHGLEATTPLSHGEAVALGLVGAMGLSVQCASLSNHEAQRVVALLQTLGLPTRLQVTHIEGALDALRQDKKRQGSHIHWVLLSALCHPLCHPLTLEESARRLREIAS